MANGSPRGIPHLPLDPRRPVVNLWRVTPHPIRISAAGVTALLVTLAMMAATLPLHGELTDAQKKELFLKREHRSGSATKKKKSSSSSSAPSSSSSSKKKSSGSGSPGSPKKSSPGSSKKHSSSSSSSSSSSHSGSTSHKSPSSSATHSGTTPAPPSATTALPAAAPLPPPLPLPRGATPSAPITIEKSGIEPDQGLEPAPTPPPAPEGFWSHLFGSHKSYTYLSASTRAAIDRAPVRKGRWKYIVVHNSGTREGNARVFDIYHRRVRHMQNGLAYHFVIGDGHGSGDGQIEIGDRWRRQINGGHVASDYLNDIALGICLVGDFNRDQPTKAQVGALEELVAYLRNRVGKSQGHQAIVHAHKEINPRPTDCPGDHFPYGWLHAKFGNER